MITALLAITMIPSQDLRAKLTTEATAIMRQYDLPSIAVAYVERDNIIATAVGTRVRGEKIPVTVNDIYHHGSNTKSMTATLLAMLVDEKKLKWDSTLAELFPDFDDMHEDYRKVTLRQLLAHQSGMEGTYPVRKGNWFNPPEPVMEVRKKHAQMCLAEPPSFVPGSAAKYSNKNYVIAGHIIERITQRPWEEVITERLFKPLGMRSAGFGPAGTPGKKDQPWPHIYDGKTWKVITNNPTADNPPVMGPAGRVHASLPDLAKYVQAHVSMDPIVSKEGWKMLHDQVGGEQFALGWIVVGRSWAKGNALTHSGNNTMNTSLIWAAPNAGFGIIVCTNADTPKVHEALDKLVGKVLQVVLQ